MRTLIFSIIFIIISASMTKNAKSADAGSDQDPKPIFSFGLIADVQYCDQEPANNRYYRNSLGKLREGLASLKEDNPAFIINLGDLIDKDFKSYKPVTRIIDSSGLKIYHVTGNHDFSVDARQKKRIPQLQSAKEAYYSFKYDNYRFILLNGNELSTYFSTNRKNISRANELLARLKSQGEINAMDWNGGMSDKQILWLCKQLNESSRNNEKVLIFCHFPVYPEDVHNLLNYRDILTVLKDYNNIIAWFSGHNHAGNYGNFNMIHFVTLRGMVETENSNSFALVEVYNNKIWIKGSGREKNQILAY